MDKKLSGKNVVMAVDCGKDATKVSVFVKRLGGRIESRKYTFRTRLALRSGLEESSFQRIDEAEYEGKGYVWGNHVSDITVNVHSNSKRDVNHKLCTLIAIAEHVDKGDSVHVAIGCPIQVFTDREAKNEYLDYIVPKGWQEIVVNGEYKYFYIASRTCFAESTGLVGIYPGIFGDRVVGVFDIGGLNVNCALFINSNLKPDKCFTTQDGYYSILNRLAGKLSDETGTDLDAAYIPSIIKAGKIEKIPHTEGIVREYMESHLKRITDTARNRGWNIDVAKLVFSGGCSELLRSYITAQFPGDLIVDDPVFANARGFLAMFVQALEAAGKI